MSPNKLNGMTLLELMVTVAILAIISAIAIPAYNGYIKTSYRTECQKEVAAIRLAEEEFFLENNTYFDGESGVGADDLVGNSNGVYQEAGEVTAGTNNCTYEVTSGDLTSTYTVNANKKAGGKLASETDPIATYTKN